MAIALGLAVGMTAMPTLAADKKTVVFGDTTFNAENEEADINPQNTYAGWACIRYGVGETLFRYSDTMEIEPWIAKEYENIDELTWKITLNDGVVFSNGRACDGEAVKESLEALVANHERAAGDLCIDTIEADGNTVTIKTTEPKPALINYLSDPYGCIIDMQAGVSDDGIVIGTGPYVATELVTDDHVNLVKNENYWNGDVNVDERYDTDALVADNSRFTISNIDTTGAIVPLYTNISADRTLDVDDILNYYKLSTIAKSGNQEIEIFQMFKDRPAEYATVGWVAVGDLACNVFVPYYPMLIDSMYEGYQAGTPTVQFTTEQPTGGLFYPYSKRSYNRETGEITTTDGYRILPEGWEKSYYWSFEILNDYVRYFESADGSKLVSDADRQYVKAKLNDLQQEFYSNFVSMQTLQSSSNARKLATENGAAMAKRAQQTAQELIAYLQGSEALTRADAVYSLWLRSGSPKAKTSACPFADVSESAYYYDAVLWAAEAGIVRGVSDSSFAPDATCTRAQAAAIAYRAAGSPSVSGDGFADADAAGYYAQPALWAKQIGAVSGSSFQPDSACSKAQLDALIGAIAA